MKFKNLVHNWESYVESTSSPNPDYYSIVSIAADDFLGSISAALSHSVFAPLREGSAENAENAECRKWVVWKMWIVKIYKRKKDMKIYTCMKLVLKNNI